MAIQTDVVTGTGQRKLLITGVPGTGKTSLGRYLAEHHGFTHLDFDGPGIAPQLSKSPDSVLYRAMAAGGKVVVTWGFPIDSWAVQKIDVMRANGFQMIWLDGDRQVALKMFTRRGDSDVLSFQAQIARIDETHIVDHLRPSIVDPFDGFGEFRPYEAISQAVLAAAFGTAHNS